MAELPKLKLSELNEIMSKAKAENNVEIMLQCTMVGLLSEIKKNLLMVSERQEGLLEDIKTSLIPFKRAVLGSTLITFSPEEDEWEDEEEDDMEE